MKRYFALVLSVLLLSAIPTGAEANSDCKKLKKRTISNQRIYETAWDRYQTTIAKYLNSPNRNQWGSEAPVVTRLKALLQVQFRIMDDLIKHENCLKPGKSRELKDLKKRIQDRLRWDLLGQFTLNTPVWFKDLIKK